MVVIYALMALIGAAVAIFAVQNLDPVVIRFITWRIEGAPLAFVILLSLLLGAVFTALVGVVRYWKLRSRIRQLEQRLAQATAAAPPRPPAPRPDALPSSSPRPDRPTPP